jgi:hypothetical protein
MKYIVDYKKPGANEYTQMEDQSTIADALKRAAEAKAQGFEVGIQDEAGNIYDINTTEGLKKVYLRQDSKFELASYAKARLELYDRIVEFEADTLQEIESHIAASEMLTDALAGETERVWRIERTDGQEVY